MPQALIIGIDHYAEPRAAQLQCAVSDALQVSSRLEAAGFQVTTLINERASKDAIMIELEVGINDRLTGPDDIAVIYWAGHGFSYLVNPHPRARDDGWRTFLLPSDAIATEPIRTAFSVRDVWDLLNKLESERVLMLLDACFSGAFGGNDGRTFLVGDYRGAPRITGEALTVEGRGKVLLTACGPEEVAREDRRGTGHGYFTSALIEALDGAAIEGNPARSGLTTSILSSYVRERVGTITKMRQTPQMHCSAEGADWIIPTRIHTRHFASLPTWAFVGTSGGVGKTTLSMFTAELLAEAGNSVLYVDVDITHLGGTREWCERVGVHVGRVRTFVDHVTPYSRARTGIKPLAGLDDSLIEVTPPYLRRDGCGKIYLLPGSRFGEPPLAAFELIADIKNRRSNEVCMDILSDAIRRAARIKASCLVIDCGAQFDPIAVNALHMAHHPFIVTAARAGAKDGRDQILRSCRDRRPDFESARVLTVVNRVPSDAALKMHWGDLRFGFDYLPDDPELFNEAAQTRQNFELGYDELTEKWHNILIESDQRGCGGAHRDFLPNEWNRFRRWATWITENYSWIQSEIAQIRRKAAVSVSVLAASLCVLTALALTLWVQPEIDTTVIKLCVAAITITSFGVILAALRSWLVYRRLAIMKEVRRRSKDAELLKEWFTTRDSSGRMWRRDRAAAIEWLHSRVEEGRRQRRAVAMKKVSPQKEI